MQFLLLSGLALVSAAVAESTSTVQLFIDNMNPNVGWAGSVVGVCSSQTTYAIACTSAAFNSECHEGAEQITITEGPSVYAVTTPAIFSETSATVTETCTFDHSASSASCVETINAGQYGQQNAVTTAFNLTGQYYHKYGVAITAGANKLGGEGDCSANTQSAASPRNDISSTILAGAVLISGLGFVYIL